MSRLIEALGILLDNSNNKKEDRSYKKYAQAVRFCPYCGTDKISWDAEYCVFCCENKKCDKGFLVENTYGIQEEK